MENGSEENKKWNQRENSSDDKKQQPPFPGGHETWSNGEHFGPKLPFHHPHNSRMAGLIVIIVGLVLLLSKIPQTAQWLPGWLLTWPMILIAIGLFIGVKHRFRSVGWLIPVIIGLAFLLKDEIFLSTKMQDLILPVLVILAGIILLVSRHRNRHCPHHHPYGRQFHRRHREHFREYRRRQRAQFMENSTEDFIDVNSTFGNVVKKVVSKKFKGGNINCSFGGTEIDLTQSDIEDTVALNMSVTFGGVEISVPSNWKIKNDISVIFGGVDDKRKHINDAEDAPKTLILTGNITCGGLEIKN